MNNIKTKGINDSKDNNLNSEKIEKQDIYQIKKDNNNKNIKYKISQDNFLENLEYQNSYFNKNDYFGKETDDKAFKFIKEYIKNDLIKFFNQKNMNS